VYPVLGQLIGGALGGLAYELTIGIHHEIDEEEDTVADASPSDVEAREAAEPEEATAKGSSPRTKN